MSKKYKDLARLIVEKIGGSENVSTSVHCQTRLRFVLKDEIKADTEGIKNIKGVANVITSGGQYQVVIGTHVAEVYEEVEKIIGKTGIPSEEKADDRNILNKLIDFITGAFSPIIPAISGAGMIKAVLAILVVFKLISPKSQTYYVINFISDSVFYYFPVLLGYTAAKKLKCSPYLAAVLGGVLIHPRMIELVTAKQAVLVLGIPMRLVNYGSTVIPIFLIVLVQKYVEDFIKKITPNAVKIIFVPLVTLLVTGIVALLFVGPLGYYAGDYIAKGFQIVQAYGNWIPSTIIGALLPIMVMFGIHTAVAPVGLLQLTSLGYEGIFGPGAMVSNIGMAVATLVASFRTKDNTARQISTSNGITALMGITEPALYGTALPKRYPLIAAIIGGGIGGFYAGITNTVRYATGTSGLPAVTLYIGGNMSSFRNILIAICITAITTGVCAYILSFRYEGKRENIVTENEDNGYSQEDNTGNESIGIKESIIYNPIKGNVIPLNTVKDEAFASESLGKGFGIEPLEGKVTAPFEGKVDTLFPTKHAIGLISNDGAEILIHVGFNTVELEGKYFEAHVEAGQKVVKGQTLITFDIDKLNEEGYLTQTPLVVLNTDKYSEIVTLKEGYSEAGEKVLKLNI